MIVLVLLIIGLLIDLWHLLAGLWPVVVVVTVLWLLCRWIILPVRDARLRDARERLRHEQARREIDRIAIETRRAMLDAALRHGDVIEGTAVEVRPK
jgi:hypothetical protein